jgi:hypothetical protein
MVKSSMKIVEIFKNFRAVVPIRPKPKAFRSTFLYSIKVLLKHFITTYLLDSRKKIIFRHRDLYSCPLPRPIKGNALAKAKISKGKRARHDIRKMAIMHF